jgi:hypothetical protein
MIKIVSLFRNKQAFQELTIKDQDGILLRDLII